ncbi:MAG: hypothetical protein J6U40_05935, partial [Kiritimatiellae bacterium]|nr:hypothetical protein [Kiritimatiellia bacterium]
MKRFGCGVGIICLAAVVSATDYTETLTVGAGESLTLTGENTAPSFLDNGSLTLSANSSLTVTSEDKTSDVANGVNATLTLESGATLDVTRVTKAASNEALGIGILGGTGTLNIAPGAFLEANGRRVRFSRNADDKRNLLSQAIVNLDGTIRLTTAELAAYFPVNAEFVANTNDYPVSSIINFSSTGLFIVSDIAVNDAARAIWNMTGGTVQFTSSQGGLFSGNY